ncbi:uncharacterized protein LOC123682600 isoform X2 [Harmonia axyridis]|uniref:uncharacterized protein LOC123682600 isoform X2 n=1 Tax=Harmonia axyridis TaxID=115357 RepID=UPI001E2789CC|nr:uncharacterized protein LOC123682600 isoform X2 [Harmonia axyridis]
MKFELLLAKIVLVTFCVDMVQSQYFDDSPEERRRGGNRRRPCIFKTKKKGNQEGRTFFDWNFQQYDISYTNNYNIDCTGGSGGGSNNHPGLLSSHFQGGQSQHPGILGSHFQGGPSQHQGLLGSHFQGGGLFGSHNQNSGGSLLGSLFNKPQGGLINNIPGISQIGNGISQTQSQTQAVSDESSFNPSGFLNPNRPILSGVGALIGNIPHNPVAQGIGSIGEGIGSILQLIPQTVQSFTSSQSSSGGFFPQGIFSSFGNFFNRPSSQGYPSQGSSSQSSPFPSQNVPQVTTPSDPDDIIYNDETVTPVNTNYDPVPDAYNNAGRPGRPRPGIYYNQNSYYNKLSPYSKKRGY